MTEIELNIEKLEEYVWRRKNHYKMLDVISKTDIDEDQLKIWKNQIDECFREKIKARL